MDVAKSAVARGASDEEIAEFIQDMLAELAEMACFLPTGQKRQLREAIAFLRDRAEIRPDLRTSALSRLTPANSC